MTVNQMVKSGQTNLYGSKSRTSEVLVVGKKDRTAAKPSTKSTFAESSSSASEYNLSAEWGKKIADLAKDHVQRGANWNSTEYKEPKGWYEELLNPTEDFARDTGANWTNHHKLSHGEIIAQAKASKAEMKANGTFGSMVYHPADPKIKAMRTAYYDALYKELNARDMKILGREMLKDGSGYSVKA